MSIASEIQALQQDKSDIATAISNKGVTVPSGSGFDSFASLINDIPTGSPPLLPSGYTQLTYIEGSGTQIIDCDYNATFDTKYECELVANSNQGTTYNCPFANHGHMQVISSRDPNRSWYTVFGNSSEKALTANAVNARVIISLDKTQCVIYGEYAYGIIYSVNMGATADTTGTYNRTCLFGRIDRVSGNFDRLFIGRIFNFKIYENNQLTVNMIPCIKDSNQEVGMYDIVRDRFFGNIGTGSFTGS